MGIYSVEELETYCVGILTKNGMEKENIDILVKLLLQANLEGVDSHGISRFPVYIKRFNDHRISLNPDVQFEQRSSSILLVDGDNGIGHLVGHLAVQKGITMAKENGVAVVSIRNSNHFGAASNFCKTACEENMACIAFTNSPPGIAPWGGTEAYFGTNPIAFGFPTKDRPPVIIDLSTSTVARGKIILAEKQGKSIPEGWAIDEYGMPTTNASEALQGSVLPLGGAKGAALAMAVEILSGVLTGAAFGPEVKSIYEENEKGKANVGHFFILMDIEKFMDIHVFLQSMQGLLGGIKSTRKASGVEEIRIPGERRHRESEKRKIEGIFLPTEVENELRRLAEEHEVRFPDCHLHRS
ncbi:Ldh family oxidoreductase [Rossellomorea marisflavi]|uniref:Ldh family oxidoreductase n=1 Tax=Rossellomorea marisflavi TaxID=189381 RepID=UPI00064E43D5|nr:Ldh family oxidoreductase [Rossellomorea marisflavi]KML25408.1 lactate dehydrogenase [Rossellomorea marisflavi]